MRGYEGVVLGGGGFQGRGGGGGGGMLGGGGTSRGGGGVALGWLYGVEVRWGTCGGGGGGGYVGEGGFLRFFEKFESGYVQEKLERFEKTEK